MQQKQQALNPSSEVEEIKEEEVVHEANDWGRSKGRSKHADV